MAITNIDIKLLWARAAGFCSKPGCSQDLTELIASGNYVVGEMAHIIASKPTARRGRPEGGNDTYDNLILLCPTHHKHIDKAPEGTFPEQMLYEWKASHESRFRGAGRGIRFESFNDLRKAISRLLACNKAVFETFGPKSAAAINDPNSNCFSIWELRRLDRIIPNNTEILNLIDENISLLHHKHIPLIEKFRVHAEAYKTHVIYRLDSYPLFPNEFGKIFV